MRKTPFTLAALILNLSLFTPNATQAQQDRLFVAVEAECLNAFIYKYDDLESFVEDLNLRFGGHNILFVKAGSLPADYLLRILYKKDPPGGYSTTYVNAFPVNKEEQRSVGPPGYLGEGYAAQETTQAEREKAAATRSPGSALVPYSTPLLVQPGIIPQQRQLAIPLRAQNGMSKMSTYAYFHIQFTLIDTHDRRIVWSEKKKTGKYVDIYGPMVAALAAQISRL